MEITLASSRPVYQPITSHVQSQISTGRLSLEDRVPSVCELAIAPATLARILANFQDQAREPADRLQKSLENLKRQIESGQLKYAASES